MQSVRWGIIGCGAVTEIKSGPGLQKAQGSELVAVMRRDPAKAQDYALRHGVPKCYADADALIADPDVNAVYIATPPGTHELYALRVCAAGKPCYVEKPMSRNAAEASRMTETFRTARVPLFIAYYRRALPRFLKAKALIDSGALGRVHTATYRYTDKQMKKPAGNLPWRLNAQDSGGGLFLDLGSHALDMLDFWLGPLTVREAFAKNGSGNYLVEDQVRIFCTTAEKIACELQFHFAARPADEFVLTGTAGELRMSCFAQEPIRVNYADGRRETIDLPYPQHVAQPLIQTIVDELRGEGTCPSTSESGLRTQIIIDQALQSYYGGREDGFWNRSWPGSPRTAEHLRK